MSELQEDDSQFKSLVNQAGEMYSSMVMKETNFESAAVSDMRNQIKEKVDTKRADLSTRSKSSQL